jgi:hypothetical protein
MTKFSLGRIYYSVDSRKIGATEGNISFDSFMSDPGGASKSKGNDPFFASN